MWLPFLRPLIVLVITLRPNTKFLNKASEAAFLWLCLLLSSQASLLLAPPPPRAPPSRHPESPTFCQRHPAVSFTFVLLCTMLSLPETFSLLTLFTWSCSIQLSGRSLDGTVWGNSFLLWVPQKLPVLLYYTAEAGPTCCELLGTCILHMPFPAPSHVPETQADINAERVIEL